MGADFLCVTPDNVNILTDRSNAKPLGCQTLRCDTDILGPGLRPKKIVGVLATGFSTRVG
jgi:hypothetical protein